MSRFICCVAIRLCFVRVCSVMLLSVDVYCLFCLMYARVFVGVCIAEWYCLMFVLLSRCCLCRSCVCLCCWFVMRVCVVRVCCVLLLFGFSLFVFVYVVWLFMCCCLCVYRVWRLPVVCMCCVAVVCCRVYVCLFVVL